MSEPTIDVEVSPKIPFLNAKIKGTGIPLRDYAIFTILLGGAFGFYLVLEGIDHHAEASDKTMQQLLIELKETNKTNIDINRSNLFYQCRTSCLLEQDAKKRDGAACDRQCAHLQR
jgi:hypothetical protein